MTRRRTRPQLYCEMMTIMCRFRGVPERRGAASLTTTAMSRLCRRLLAALAAFCGSLVCIPSVAVAGEPVAEHPTIVTDAIDALGHYQRWMTDTDPWAYLDWVAARDHVAHTAAAALGLDETAMLDAWVASPIDGQVTVIAAITQLGVPYRRYARAEGEAFDCSGLTSWAWEQAGTTLERSSRYQDRAAERIDAEEATVGDLVYYPGHIMLYLGIGDAVVHAPTQGRTVELQVLSERSARRVTFADPTPE